MARPVLVLVLLLSLAPLAAAQADAPVSNEVAITLESHSAGGGGYFTLEGQSERNPTLKFPAGAKVTITLKAADAQGTHNVCFNTNAACSDYVEAPGTTQTLTFTVPASGTASYYCLPHKSSGMAGRIEATAAASAPTPPPEPPKDVAFTVITHSEGGGGYFTLEGETARNPTLSVPAGATVTITVKAGDGGGTHNLCQADNAHCSDYVEAEGETVTFTFMAPASGTLQYYCLPHKSSGMAGKIEVVAASGGTPSPGGGSGEAITGDTVDLGSLGHPECAGTMIPSSVAKGVVGGPTVDDYVAACKSAAGGATPGRPAHAVDYVIPASVVLIGLGVVGVVWAHRSYKP